MMKNALVSMCLESMGFAFHFLIMSSLYGNDVEMI